MQSFTRLYMGDTDQDARAEARYWGHQATDVVRVVDVSDQLLTKAARGQGGPTQRALAGQVAAGTRAWAVTQRRLVGDAQ